jgi:hypothetical protein
VPTAPPIVIETIPPPIVGSAARTRFWHQGRFVTLDLLFHDERAILVIEPEAGLPVTTRLDSPDRVLALLADTRAAPLWPELIKWAGPSLERLRERRLAAAEEAWRQGRIAYPLKSTAESAAAARTTALFQYAGALEEAGEGAKAQALLREHLAALPLKTAEQRFQWSLAAISLANSLYRTGDVKGAVAVSEHAQAVLGDSPFALNPAVNRAAYLAETGSYAEALAGIEQAQARFEKTTEKSDEGIAGSERQFGWIRACALAGLGRSQEAQRALAPVLTEQEPSDRDFLLESNFSIRFRAMRCMRDKEAVVRALVADIERAPVAPGAFLLLQPGLRRPWLTRFWEIVRSDPRIKAATAGRMRQLPPEFEAVMNRSALRRSGK